MKQIFLVFNLIILFFGFSSCKKSNDNSNDYLIDTHVEGYIIDLITHDSLTNVEVQLWEDDRGGSGRLEDFDRQIAGTATDNNGYFRINFTGSRIKYYGIRAIHENYYTGSDLSTFGTPPTSIVNFLLSPLSWLKIHIKNEPPSNVSDSLYFFYNIALKGANIDTMFIRQFETISTQLDIWDITKNGITIRNSAFTSCTPFDTCQLTIFY